MKTIQVHVEENDYNVILKRKGERNWIEYLLGLPVGARNKTKTNRRKK